MKSSFELLPKELLDKILAYNRVNDQICLAHTSKHFLNSITTRKGLVCNSPNESVRNEGWRFTWIGDPWPPNFPRSFDKKDVKKLLPNDRFLVKRYLTRCKRLSSKNLRLRLAGSRTRNEPAIRVPTSKYEQRKPSTRRAAIEATFRMQKMRRR